MFCSVVHWYLTRGVEACQTTALLIRGLSAGWHKAAPVEFREQNFWLLWCWISFKNKKNVYLLIFFQCLDDALCWNICSWNKGQFSLYIQCHGCGWPGIARSQGIASIHGIDLVILDSYMTGCEYCCDWNWYLRSHILVFICSCHNCQLN